MTSVRLFELLTLLQARRHWRGQELARRLEVSPRTVRNDVTRLRELGYPITSVPGIAGGYRMSSGAALPPLPLDDEEAMSLAISLRCAQGDLAEPAMRALAKLERVLPTRLRHQVMAVRSAAIHAPKASVGVDAAVLATLTGACQENDTLRFDYQDNSGTHSRRAVQPHQIVHYGCYWFLVGWDTDRADWRTFRVDRMRAQDPTGPRFVPRAMPEDEAIRRVTGGIVHARRKAVAAR